MQLIESCGWPLPDASYSHSFPFPATPLLLHSTGPGHPGPIQADTSVAINTPPTRYFVPPRVLDTVYYFKNSPNDSSNQQLTPVTSAAAVIIIQLLPLNTATPVLRRQFSTSRCDVTDTFFTSGRRPVLSPPRCTLLKKGSYKHILDVTGPDLQFNSTALQFQ